MLGRIGNNDEESSVLFQLLSSVVQAGNKSVAVHIPYIISSLVGALSKCISHDLEPWSQVRISFHIARLPSVYYFE